MKKILIIALSMALLLAGCTGDSPKSDMNNSEYSLDLQNIKGNVSHIKQRCYEKNEEDIKYISYYEMGYYSSANFDADYDEFGNPLSITEYPTFVDYPEVTWKSEFDANNILRVFTAEFGANYSTRTEYETKDGLVVIKDGVSHGRRFVTNNGEEEEFEGARTYYDKDFRVTHYMTGDDNNIPALYEYNAKGYVKACNWSEGTEITQKATFTYNDKNYMDTLVIDYMTSKDHFNFEYEYDEQGNWIKQFVYLEGKHYATTIREYTYSDN